MEGKRLWYPNIHELHRISADSTSSKFQDTRSSASYLLFAYFRVYYYTGLIPFKFRIDEKSQRYIAVTSTLQTIFWMCVTLIRVFNLSCWIATIWAKRKEKQQNANAYYDLSQCYGHVILLAFFTYGVWKKSKVFENLLNEYNENTFSHSNCRGNCRRQALRSLYLFFVVVIAPPIAKVLRALGPHGWDFEKYYKKNYKDGHNMLKILFQADLNVTESSKPFLASVRIVTSIYSSLSASVHKLLLLISGYLLLRALEGVKESLRKCSDIRGFYIYLRLKKLSEINNNALGTTILGFVVGTVPQMMYDIPNLIQPKGVMQFLWPALLFSFTIVFLCMAATIQTKAPEIFSDWLNTGNNFLRFERSQLILFLRELDKEKIGFSAAGIVSLNVSFLAGVLSMGITMAVVIIGSEHIEE